MAVGLSLLQVKYSSSVYETLHKLVVELTKEDSPSRILLVGHLLGYLRLHYYVLLVAAFEYRWRHPR